MPRPSSKPELLRAANEGFEKLWALIGSLSEEERCAEFHFGEELLQKEAHWARDKGLRDVLAHLYEWHLLLLNFVKANLAGEPQPFLPQPYNWKNYALMNRAFFEKHQATPYAQAESLLRGSHAEVLALIEGFSGEELFEKGRFGWVGGTTLGSYCISATSSHYDWAIKKIKAHQKALARRNDALR
ncbi:MAG: ClbS/DfsB family four-helix bundle protein [Christensenellaceae bacterium]|nr:ClbS/DfsB family four-helix bundle protein [Christensenellaceae bacterium]